MPNQDSWTCPNCGTVNGYVDPFGKHGTEPGYAGCVGCAYGHKVAITCTNTETLYQGTNANNFRATGKLIQDKK
jgi:hypothetical protein